MPRESIRATLFSEQGEQAKTCHGDPFFEPYDPPPDSGKTGPKIVGFSGETGPEFPDTDCLEKLEKKVRKKWKKRYRLGGGPGGPKIVQVLEAEIGFRKLPPVAVLMRILMRNSKWQATADGSPGPKIVQVLEAEIGFNFASNCTRPVKPKSLRRYQQKLSKG